MRDILKITSDLTGQTQAEIVRMAVTLYCQSVIYKGILEVDNSMVKK